MFKRAFFSGPQFDPADIDRKKNLPTKLPMLAVSHSVRSTGPIRPNAQCPFSPLSPVFVPAPARPCHAIIAGAFPPTATAPVSYIADCEWACGFTVSLEEVLRGFSRDASLAARCERQGFDSADRSSLARFIVERNLPLLDGGSPLASLYESLCRWDEMPAAATPQLLLDISGSPLAAHRRDPKLLETLLREEAATTPVWFVTRRRCRCRTRLDLPGVGFRSEDSTSGFAQAPHVPTSLPAELGLTGAHALCPLGDGSLFQDSPGCVMRVICQSGATFGWGIEELAGIIVVRRRWGFDASQTAGRFTAQPLALMKTTACARLLAFGGGHGELFGRDFSSVALSGFLPDFW